MLDADQRPVPGGLGAPRRHGRGVRQHRWITDPEQTRDETGGLVRRPGVLVEWRVEQGEGGWGWEGRVAYAVPGRVGAVVMVETWVSAAHLTPTEEPASSAGGDR